MSLDESSPLLSSAAGGTEVVVSVDLADMAGDCGASIEVRPEAGAEAEDVGGSPPKGGFRDIITNNRQEGLKVKVLGARAFW